MLLKVIYSSLIAVSQSIQDKFSDLIWKNTWINSGHFILHYNSVMANFNYKCHTYQYTRPDTF